MKKTIAGRVLLAVMLAFSYVAVDAQDYPSRLIKIVVPTAPGGSVDRVARIVAQKLQEKWDKTITVENRAGASGNIGAEVVFRAMPDGYTLMVATPGPLINNKILFGKLAYDPDAFVPISAIAEAPQVLVVHPRVGVDSLEKLIALAQARPDTLNFASAGTGTTPHLTAELFKFMAAVKIVHVPFKGNAPALANLVGGQVDLLFDSISTSLPHIRAGSTRALGVSSAKRHRSLPTIPAISELLSGFHATTWYGMVAPPGTSSAIANKLSATIAELLKQPDVAKRLLDIDIDAIGSTPGEMAQFMSREREVWGKVIRAAGITSAE